jgi:hypothetical protein
VPFQNTLLSIACVALIAACTAGQSDSSAPERVDIAKVSTVKSTFGPQFKIVTAAPSGIDPKLLAPQRLPEGVTVDPADCAKYAAGQGLPPGLKGNMSALSAEGEGNRFIAIAVETSQTVPFDSAVADKCKHVTFNGPNVNGVVDVVEAPHVDGARTLGTHRVLQATIGGTSRSGELYNYVAYLTNYLVVVTANPLVVPDQPVAAVNVQRAKDLLAASVAAVRS